MHSFELLSDPLGDERPIRRVRDYVKDGFAVICCSAVVSSVAAVILTLVAKLAG